MRKIDVAAIDAIGRIRFTTSHPLEFSDSLIEAYATPALVGDRLYVFARQGDSEVTSCLDAATGKEIFRDSKAVSVLPLPSVLPPGQEISQGGVGGVAIYVGMAAAEPR